MIRVPEALEAARRRGPEWSAWLDVLPGRVAELLADWRLTPEGATRPGGGPAEPWHGSCSVVTPVRTEDGRRAVLKVAFPHPDGAHEHLALRCWAGDGAVELLRADPNRSALLLERLPGADLTGIHDLEACEIVAGLYPRLHVPAPPRLRTLGPLVERWTQRLRQLDRDAPLPRRLVEQAISLGTGLAADPASGGTLIHTDLHYGNVLAAERAPWLVIDPKPLSGDPHYEIAPMLWNRWGDLARPVRSGIRRRFDTIVDVAGLDEERARDWVVVRMVHNASRTIIGPAHPVTGDDHAWLTACIAVAKAVQG